MRPNRSKLHRITTAAVLTAVAFMFSYIESILPFRIGIPGVKLGLCHIVTVFALRRLSWQETTAITFVRVSLSALLFGNVTSLAYSACGAALSLAVMLLLRLPKRSGKAVFSLIGISVAGGVAHNLGQILAAMLLMSTPSLGWYLPVLILSGVITGSIIGAVGALAAARVPSIPSK